MKTDIITAILSTSLLLISCSETSDTEKSDDFSDKLIMNIGAVIHDDTGTNAGMSTEQLGSFGLFVENSNSPKFSYSNVYMLKNENEVFESRNYPDNSPIKIYWQNLTTPVTITTYAPYDPNVSHTSICTISVATDQSTIKAIEHSDFVYQKQAVDPTKDRDSEGKVSIKMMHQLAKFILKISLSTDLSLNGPENPISKIAINGTKTEGEFRLSDGMLQQIKTVNEITPHLVSYQFEAETHSVAVYEAILIPQDVDATTFQVTLTVQGKTYQYNVPSKVTLTKDTPYSLSVKAEPNGIIVPWSDGEEVVMTPDLTKRVTLNTQVSIVPEKAKLEVDKQLLHLSYRGGTGTLVFNGDFDKKLTITDADPRLTIVSNEVRYKNTSFNFTALQPENGESYATTIRLTNALLTHDKGFEITILVDANRMPSVRMGGLEWMAYNGIGQETALYPKLEVDQTVRDVYREHWRDYTAMCMWGARQRTQPMLYPWEVARTTNTSGSLTATNLWGPESTNIPCPAGWRLPTATELSAIWPDNGASATAAYVRNGVTYTPTIAPSGAPAIPVAGNEDIQTNLYIISDGNEELVFPMSGWRDCDELTGYRALMARDAGKAFFLWTANQGQPEWMAKASGINNNNTSFNNISDKNKTTRDAFQSVRCVKNSTN